jgi:hypothetical protein
LKRVLLLAIGVSFVVLAGLLPFDGTDIAKLHPVEVLAVSRKGDAYVLQTDSGMKGVGKNVEEALHDLQLSTAGNIFLDTANYLLISPDCADVIMPLWNCIRPACQVYYYECEGIYAEIGRYLESHPSQATVLRCLQGEKEIPRLRIEGEKIRIDRE